MAKIKHSIIRDMKALNLTDAEALTDQERQKLQQSMSKADTPTSPSM